MRKDQVS